EELLELGSGSLRDHPRPAQEIRILVLRRAEVGIEPDLGEEPHHREPRVMRPGRAIEAFHDAEPETHPGALPMRPQRLKQGFETERRRLAATLSGARSPLRNREVSCGDWLRIEGVRLHGRDPVTRAGPRPRSRIDRELEVSSDRDTNEVTWSRRTR